MLARLAQIVILGALDRALTPRPDAVSRYPGIEARLALYHPVLIGIARALIFAVAAIGLLQLWGLGTFDWLVATDLGRRVLSSLLTLAVTVLLAVAVWEAVNAGGRAAPRPADARGAGRAFGAAAHAAAAAAHDAARSPS